MASKRHGFEPSEIDIPSSWEMGSNLSGNTTSTVGWVIAETRIYPCPQGADSLTDEPQQQIGSASADRLVPEENTLKTQGKSISCRGPAPVGSRDSLRMTALAIKG